MTLLEYHESQNIRFKKNGLSRLDRFDENHEGLVCLFRQLAFCDHPLGLGFKALTEASHKTDAIKNIIRVNRAECVCVCFK